MILLIKCYRILATLRKERLALFDGRKGGLCVNNSDLILHLVEKLIAEREKNILLEQQQKQQQMQKDNNVKTKM